MTPEVMIRRTICSYLKLKRVFIFVHDSTGIWDPTRKVFRRNVDPYRIKGVSDLLGIYKGKFLAIEVKNKGNYPTPEQKKFLEIVNQNGGIGFVARSIEDVKAHLELDLPDKS